jgi:hypothetical protein
MENFPKNVCGLGEFELDLHRLSFEITILSNFEDFISASANPRPAGRMRPLKLFSAALQLSLEIVLLQKNQQNY